MKNNTDIPDYLARDMQSYLDVIGELRSDYEDDIDDILWDGYPYHLICFFQRQNFSDFLYLLKKISPLFVKNYICLDGEGLKIFWYFVREGIDLKDVNFASHLHIILDALTEISPSGDYIEDIMEGFEEVIPTMLGVFRDADEYGMNLEEYVMAYVDLFKKIWGKNPTAQNRGEKRSVLNHFIEFMFFMRNRINVIKETRPSDES